MRDITEEEEVSNVSGGKMEIWSGCESESMKSGRESLRSSPTVVVVVRQARGGGEPRQ